MRERIVRATSRVHGATVHPRRARILVRALDTLLPEGASVLDVGSGDGLVGAALMQRRPDIRVHGIDVFERPRALIETRRFDGRRIPHPDRSFDAVMLLDVLHHTLDPEPLLREAARVAARSVIIKDHFRSGFAANATLRFMDWVGNRGHGVALPYRYLSEPEWRQLFARVALEIETLERSLHLYPPPFHWIFDRELHFLARLLPAGASRAG